MSRCALQVFFDQPWVLGRHHRFRAPVSPAGRNRLDETLTGCLRIAQVLTGSTGWKHGGAILRADDWRGPYRMVASDTFDDWVGSTANAEDPFLWVDKRGHWHVLYEGNPMPGAHAYSIDGLTWSNISMALDGPTEGAFNFSRPYVSADGTHRNVSYYTARPKLLFDRAGTTPTHLYGATNTETCGFSVASPLVSSADHRS